METGRDNTSPRGTSAPSGDASREATRSDTHPVHRGAPRRPGPPYTKLRRLAARAIRVVEDLAPKHPAIAVYRQTLIPEARAFIAAHDNRVLYGLTRRREQAEGRSAVKRVGAVVRAWLPRAERDIPGLSEIYPILARAVPDDVISAAGTLRQAVANHRSADGTPLFYRDRCVSALAAAMEQAGREAHEAETAAMRHGDLSGELRRRADALRGELTSLRRTLGAIVGRSHRAYQTLRVRRQRGRTGPDAGDEANDGVDATSTTGPSAGRAGVGEGPAEGAGISSPVDTSGGNGVRPAEGADTPAAPATTPGSQG